jgi:hypothetical protein
MTPSQTSEVSKTSEFRRDSLLKIHSQGGADNAPVSHLYEIWPAKYQTTFATFPSARWSGEAGKTREFSAQATRDTLVEHRHNDAAKSRNQWVRTAAFMADVS